MQAAGAYLGGLPGLFAGTVGYSVLKYLLQRRPKSFQKAGLKLMADENYQEAADEFEAGYQYFEQRRWLDRFRAISMLDHTTPLPPQRVIIRSYPWPIDLK